MSEMAPVGPAGGVPPPEQPRPSDKGKSGGGALDLGREAVHALNDQASSRDSTQKSGGGDWFGFTDGNGNWNTGTDASGPGSGEDRPPVKPEPGDNRGSPPGDQGSQGNTPPDSSADGQDRRDESEDHSAQDQEDDAGKPLDGDRPNDTDRSPEPETPGRGAAESNREPRSVLKDEDDQKTPGQQPGKPENTGEEPERKKEKSPGEKDKTAPGQERDEKPDAPGDKEETGEGASEKEGKGKGEEGQPAGEPGGKQPGQPGQKNAWMWKYVGKRPPGSAVSRAPSLPKGSGAASSHANPAPPSQSPLRQFQQESAARRTKLDAVVAWNEHVIKRAEAQDVAQERKLRQLGQAAVKKK